MREKEFKIRRPQKKKAFYYFEKKFVKNLKVEIKKVEETTNYKQ